MRARTACEVTGTVQGVGFRAYVARLARERGLAGWVANAVGGVRIEIEGESESLVDFVAALQADPPSRARVEGIRTSVCSPVGECAFRIGESLGGDGPAGGALTAIAADGATCAACLAEVLDATDRRHRYAFTSCTDCGPRYSVLDALPYDRSNTSMRAFELCAECRAEVESGGDPRYHAQANACPRCGPMLEWLDARGVRLARADAALVAAIEALQAGGIVAVKGLGGFQLLCDATDRRAVAELRRRKRRPHKPFALLLGALDEVRLHCELSACEAEQLSSSAAPIVLLRRRIGRRACGRPTIARAVAPASGLLGVMLPCTPLHHLLAREVGRPLVATSGNRSGEPMPTRTADALERLADVADRFLTHDRRIVRALDDSVVRVVAGRALVLRCARGLAPVSVTLPRAQESADRCAARDGAHGAGSGAGCTLALGGHLKSALAVSRGRDVVVGEHLGDLDSSASRRGFDAALHAFPALYGVRARTLVRDAHPDYHSSRAAERIAAESAGDGKPLRTLAVPHHVAHVFSCLADNALDGPALGVAWDGAGHGGDASVWGGEFLHVRAGTVRRVAHLQPMRLPGGEAAAREPRRAAVGALHALHGAGFTRRPEIAGLAPLRRFDRGELVTLERMLLGGVNSPWSSSAGRLFDAVAALLGLVQRTTFEGQAATLLERLADDPVGNGSCRASEVAAGHRAARRMLCTIVAPVDDASRAGSRDPASLVLDWRPALRALLSGRAEGAPRAALARGFHAALVRGIVDVARRVGEPRVVLSGGCFQNARLLEGAVAALAAAGFEPVWHRRVPPNDGGLALGQAAFATRFAVEQQC